MTDWVVVAEASKFAIGRAVAVLWGAVVAVGLYLALLTFGPPTENAVYPVVADFRLLEKDLSVPGEVTFVVSFKKVRDCDYRGVTWFAISEEGLPVRVQAQQPEALGPVRSGPLGSRVGSPQTLRYPPGSVSFFGYLSHDCGWPWVTKASVGPYSLSNPNLSAK